MTVHHPHDELLLSYAAGSLPETTAVLVATHLALCPACRKSVSVAECVGGELMCDILPAPMGAGALDATLSRLDDEHRSAAVPRPHGDARLPRPLCDYVPSGLDALKWRRIGMGFRYAALKSDTGGRLGLLQGPPGAATPHHGHGGDEFTMVLAGGYSDETQAFARGDVQWVDGDVTHRQVVSASESCLCLVLTRGGIRPSHPLLRLMAPFLPF